MKATKNGWTIEGTPEEVVKFIEMSAYSDTVTNTVKGSDPKKVFDQVKLTVFDSTILISAMLELNSKQSGHRPRATALLLRPDLATGVYLRGWSAVAILEEVSA